MDNIFYTKLVAAGSRLYYFDCRTSGNGGDAYISISEVPCNGKNRQRHRIFIHSEDFGKFIQALGEAVAAFGKETKHE